MFRYPDRIEQYLQKNFTDHVQGYRKGWLDIHSFNEFDKQCYHIYTKVNGKKKIIGTVI
jgi:hypothetical protein